jgi:voltage-gated potassium channel Kch
LIEAFERAAQSLETLEGGKKPLVVVLVAAGFLGLLVYGVWSAVLGINHLIDSDASLLDALRDNFVNLDTLKSLSLTLLEGGVLVAIVASYFRLAKESRDAWVSRRARNHTVICGMSTRGTILAESLANGPANQTESGQSSTGGVVVVDIQDKHHGASEVRSWGVAVLKADATSDQTFRDVSLERAKTLVCVTDSDETNLRIAEAAMRSLNTRPTARRSDRLQVFCHIKSAALRHHLAGMDFFDSEAIRYRSFSVDELTAWTLLRASAPDRRMPDGRFDRRAHVVLFGDGELAVALALEMAQKCHYYRSAPWNQGEVFPQTTVLTLVGKKSKDLVSHICSEFPAVPELLVLEPLTVQSLSRESLTAAVRKVSRMGSEEIPATAVYVAMDDEVTSLTVASEIALILEDQGEQSARPEITVATPARRHQIDLARWLKQHPDIKLIPSYDNCTGDKIVNEFRDVTAKLIHQQYAGQGRNRMEDWEDLSEFLRESNRQAADGLEALRRTVDDLPKGESVPANFDECLAQMEHRRWYAFHRLRGWQLIESAAEGSKPRKDTRRKRHPLLKPFDALDPHDKAYNLDLVKTLRSVANAGAPNQREI